MTKEELKNKCTERVKIFQQAMESCKSSSLIDCIEWFADRIAELEKENAELKNERNAFKIYSDGAELDAINLSEQLTKTKEIIKGLLELGSIGDGDYTYVAEAEQFLNSEVEK